MLNFKHLHANCKPKNKMCVCSSTCKWGSHGILCLAAVPQIDVCTLTLSLDLILGESKVEWKIRGMQGKIQINHNVFSLKKENKRRSRREKDYCAPSRVKYFYFCFHFSFKQFNNSTTYWIKWKKPLDAFVHDVLIQITGFAFRISSNSAKTIYS